MKDIIRLELPADHRYSNVLGACIAAVLERVIDLAEPAVLVYNVQLAAQEIYTNITTHAYAEQSEGRISVTLTLEHPPRRLIIDLRDTGLSFKPSDVPAPNLDVVQTQGYGLFLTRQLMDEVNYYPQNGNNRWRLVKNL